MFYLRKNPWSYTSILPYVFMAWCLVMCRLLLSEAVLPPVFRVEVCVHEDVSIALIISVSPP
jgi:hypothetical protein